MLCAVTGVKLSVGWVKTPQTLLAACFLSLRVLDLVDVMFVKRLWNCLKQPLTVLDSVTTSNEMSS